MRTSALLREREGLVNIFPLPLTSASIQTKLESILLLIGRTVFADALLVERDKGNALAEAKEQIRLLASHERGQVG